MKLLATIVEGGCVVGLVHGPDAYDQRITVNGRVWRFDHDDRFGPLWLRKDGAEVPEPGQSCLGRVGEMAQAMDAEEEVAERESQR